MLLSIIFNIIVVVSTTLLVFGESDNEEKIALGVIWFGILMYFTYWINKNKHEDKDLAIAVFMSYLFFGIFVVLPLSILEIILGYIFESKNTQEILWMIIGLPYGFLIFSILKNFAVAPPSYPKRED
tara:strand:- start:1665 stop:2045 length:381 start_codon:yes stop_codon:yes gene_type:complete